MGQYLDMTGMLALEDCEVCHDDEFTENCSVKSSPLFFSRKTFWSPVAKFSWENKEKR